MTAELGYSFIDVNFEVQRIAKEMMTRAVRVKETVKEKLSRVYNAFLASFNRVEGKIVEEEKKLNEVVEPKGGIEFLIDLSDENLAKLSSVSKEKQNSDRIDTSNQRQVLFTGNLRSKVQNVSSKWLKQDNNEVSNPEPVKAEETVPVNEVEKVIPASWAALEETPLVAPEEPKEEEKENDFVPSFNFGDVNEEETETSEEEPIENPEINIELPVLPTPNENVIEPTFTVNETGEVEPVQSEISNEEYVAEPTPVEEKTEEPKEEPKMSAEDKIAELLNRAIASKEEAEEKIEPTSEDDKTKETPDKSEDKPNQALIIARLQRIGKENKEKEAKISTLTEKVSGLESDNKELKSKLAKSEKDVADLTNKNAKLEEQVDKLDSANKTMEATYEEKMSSLKTKVEEMSKARREEHEAAKKKEEKIEENHAKEIERLKQAHADEISKLNDANERRIEAIYRAISEALGEPVKEEKTK